MSALRLARVPIEASSSDVPELRAAFPSALSEDVAAVERIIPSTDLVIARRGSSVEIDGESLAIPWRIYNPEPPDRAVGSLPDLQQVILHCIYTRHHDGFVRQKHLEHAVRSDHPWVAPFIVQLVGEYVLEIVVTIQQALSELDQPGTPVRETYGRFLAQNPSFFALTRQRVVSYWDCYYRNQCAKNAYPGFALIASLEAALDATND
jgi:hypothetical protein